MPPSAPCNRQSTHDVVDSSSPSTSAHMVLEQERNNKLKSDRSGVRRVLHSISDEQNRVGGDNLNSSNTNELLYNNNTNPNSSLYNSNSMLYGSGGGGSLGGYVGYGGFTSPLMGGSMMTSPMWYGGGAGMGPLSSLNQMLFGVQTLIVSLGQAVQIIGMNTQALHQVVQSMTSMFDHAAATFYELQSQHALLQGEKESEDMKKKRRRLQALRWALVTGVSYAVYRIIRRILVASRGKNKRNYYLTQQQYMHSPYHNSDPQAWSASVAPYYNPSGVPSPNSYSGGGVGGSGYYGGGMMQQSAYPQHGYGSSPGSLYGSPYSTSAYY